MISTSVLRMLRGHRVASSALRSAALSAAVGRDAPGAQQGRPLHSQVRFASAASKKSPYAVLGIKRTATKEEIKKAYRVMARKHHPDAPGGDHQRFQEIQEAYEQIKTGVYISPDGEGSGGSGGSGRSQSMYSNLRYRTRTHQTSNVSFEDFYTEMHTGKVKKNPFAEEEARAAAKQRENLDKNSKEAHFAAWFRFLTLWCVTFVTMRVVLFLIFPPKKKEVKKKPPLPAALAQGRTGNRSAAPKPVASTYEA